MRPAVSAALVLAALWGCSGGFTHESLDLGDGGPPPIGPVGTQTDAGSDAGTDAGPDAGDAGPDAGCAALTLAGVPAVDGCPTGSVPATATGTVNTVNCTIDISLSSASGPCSGTVSGASNAFDGGCQSGFFTCTSSSLPGTLNCVYGTSICAIKICDAGTSCP